MEGGSPSAPGALARVRVMLSRPVVADPAPSAPLAGTSRLHRRAAYTRCLRCAGAPRRPASGSGLSLPFRPDMPSSLTPGSSDIACVQCRDADAAFAEIRAARHSQNSRNPFHAGLVFRGFTGSRLLRPVRLLAPLDGSDRVSPATGGFYIQASDGSVSLTVAGYDYNSTGLLCWRDFHPQEWQLASLHRTGRAPAPYRCRADGRLARPSWPSSPGWSPGKSRPGCRCRSFSLSERHLDLADEA